MLQQSLLSLLRAHVCLIALYKPFKNCFLVCWQSSKPSDTHLPNSLPTRVPDDLYIALQPPPALL